MNKEAQQNRTPGAGHGAPAPSPNQSGGLKSQLAAFERQYHRVKFRTGMARTLMVGTTVLLIACMIDYNFALSFTGRIMLSLACYTATAAFAFYQWLLPAFLPVRTDKLAWMIERIHPEFDEKLVSSVEFSKSNDKNVSRELLHRVLHDAELDLSRVKAEQAMPLTWRHFALPGAILLVFAVLLVMPDFSTPLLVKRVMLPSRRDASVGAFRLSFVRPEKDSFIEGRKVRFVVRSTDQTITDVELVLEGARNRRVPMQKNPDGNLTAEVKDIFADFDYRAVSGKVSTRLHAMKMIKLPRIHRFVKKYSFPGYTGLDPVNVTARSGGLRALEGSKAQVTVETTEALASAWVEYGGEHILAAVSEDGKSLTFSLTIGEAGEYELHLVNERREDAVSILDYAVESVPDQVPDVEMSSPAEDLLVENNEVIPVRWNSKDDYGVVTQAVCAYMDGRKLKKSPSTASATNVMLDLGELKLFSGDSIQLHVTAGDATGQKGRSAKRNITVVQGIDLQKSTGFLKAGRRAFRAISRGELEFEEILQLRSSIRDARVYKTNRGIENLEHNSIMLEARKKKLSRELKNAVESCRKMGQFAFFTKGGGYSYLTSDFIEQERLYRLPMLTPDRVTSDAWENTESLFNLSIGMTTGLVAIAEKHVPYLSAQLLERIAQHACLHEDRQSRRWTRRIKKGALELAVEHAPEFTNALQRVKPARMKHEINADAVYGLRGRLHPGSQKYPQIWSDGKPGDGIKQRYDKSLSFSSVKQMGMEPRKPFSAAWQGYLLADTAGTHQFHLESRGAARLYIDGKAVVRDDDSHGLRERHGTAQLDRGLNRISVVYKSGTAGGALRVTWNAKGGPRRELDRKTVLSSLGNGELKLLEIVSRLRKSLKKQATDFSRLDELAARIRRRMKQSRQTLSRMTERLESTSEESDWRRVEHTARNLDREAESQPLSAKSRDRKLAAKALREAARERDPAKARKAVDALNSVNKWHRKKSAEKRLGKVLEEASRELDSARKAIRRGDATWARQQSAGRLKNLSSKLEQAAALAGAEQESVESDRFKRIKNLLADADSKSEDAFNKAMDGRGVMPEEDLESLDDSLLKAGALARPEKKDEENYKLALKQLESIEPPIDRKMARARREIQDAVDTVRARTDSPDDLADLRTGRDKLDAAAEDLAAVADQLEERAESRLMGDAQESRNATAALALAEAVENAERHVKSSRDAIVNSVTQAQEEEDPEGEKLRKKAKEKLSNAVGELGELEEIAKQWEASEKKELSPEEESILSASIDNIAEKYLPAHLLSKLNELETLQDASRDLDTLSRAAADSVDSPGRDKVNRLGKKADKTQQKLEEYLRSGDRKAALEAARSLVEEAGKKVSELDNDLKDVADSKGPDARILDMETKADDASLAIKKAEAARKALGRGNPDAEESYRRRVERPLRKAVADSKTGKAIEAVKKALDKSEKMLNKGRDKQIGETLNEAEKRLREKVPSRESAAGLHDAMDSAGKSAQTAAREREKARQHARKAAADSTDDAKKNALRRAEREVTRNNLKEAVKAAKKAGKAGKKTVESLKEAMKARKKMAEELSKAKTEAAGLSKKSAEKAPRKQMAEARKGIPEVKKLLADYQKDLSALKPTAIERRHPDPESRAVERQDRKEVLQTGLDRAEDDLKDLNQALKRARAFGEEPRKAAQAAHLPLKAEAMKMLQDLPDAATEKKQKRIDKIRKAFPHSPSAKHPELLRETAGHLPEEHKESKKKLTAQAEEMEQNAKKTGWEEGWEARRNKALNKAGAAARKVDRKLNNAGAQENSPVRELARAVRHKTDARDLDGAERSAAALNRAFNESAASHDNTRTPDTGDKRTASGKEVRSRSETSPAPAELARAAARETRQARNHPRLHREPLEEALNQTKERKIGKAARLAARTPYAEDALVPLKAAEAGLENAWKQMGQAVAAPAQEGRRNDEQWQEVAEKMDTDDLRAAASKAEQIGPAGKQIATTLREAEEAAANAEQKLAAAIKAAQQNPHKQRAQDLIEEAHNEIAAREEAAGPETAVPEFPLKELTDAQEALQKDDFTKAQDALTTAAGRLHAAMPSHPRASDSPGRRPPSARTPDTRHQAQNTEAGRPVEADAVLPSPSAASALASAAARLSRAAEDLGSETPQTARAARALESSREQMQHAQRQTAGQIASGSGLSDSYTQDTGESGESRGGSGAKAIHEGAIAPGMLGDGWEGTDGRVQSRDMGNRASSYSPYYREAMKQYMKRIAEERAARNPAKSRQP